MTSPLPYNRENALASSIASDNAEHIAGKIVLTTGVTQGGLGAHFVEQVAKHKPALLILAGRSPAKVQSTVDKIKADPASAGVEIRVLALDLASQQNVRQAAQEVLAYPEQRIDVLVNSAGLMAGPYKLTEDGLEMQLATNHVGHFLFTNLIMPRLLASPSPHVVNVSSSGHRLSGVRFDDWNFDGGKAYNQWEGYGQSKTANILFSKALAEKLGGRGLRAYSLHPGVTLGTSLAAQGFGEKDLAELAERDSLGGWNHPFDMKNIDECAATHVVAAFDPRLEDHNGAYLADGNLCDNWQAVAGNPADIEKLWKLSERLVGEEFCY